MTAATGAPAVEAALARLDAARRTGTPCAPVRDLLGEGIEAAYAVQSAWVASRVAAGARVVGRKIGLTNPAVQAQLGVDSPDFGALLDEMAVADGGTADTAALLQPRIEAELAFVLGGDLGADADEAAARAVIASAHPALEIVDSRIAGWDIRLVDTVADDASAAMFVVGDAAAVPDDPAAVAMTMDRDGERVSEGHGRDCLGSPLAAVAWLARTAAAFGDPLRAGDVVLSGALGRVVPVRAGDAFTARFSGVGEVSVTFGAGR